MRTSHTLLGFLTVLFLLGAILAPPVQSQSGAGGPVAELHISATELRWTPRVPHAGLVLLVAAPNGAVARRAFDAQSAPVFALTDASGQRWPDGSYTYELRLNPLLDAAARAALAAAAADDTGRAAAVERLHSSGALPPEQLQSGHFSIADGAFVLPSAQEPTSAPPAQSASARDQVIADDLIVQGGICAGFDCVNGEDFNFITLKLKENNLRIRFDDTSASAGFPANDWQLTANDTNGGGANYFSIEDITGARTPFTIAAGAPTNALYVSSSGNIGLNTATPSLDLHMNQGDTPALRLEQNNTGGFSAQTWDVGANEANFFVRDLTGGSRLSFRIRPGAPTSSIDIAASGNVGLGTATPLERLHVVGNALVAGNLQVEGAVTELSDVHAKRGFVPVDGAALLERLRQLPITSWHYRNDPSGAQHIGPTAQDFYATFELGVDNRHIAPLDTNGVALAAIKELDRQALARDARIAALERENAALAERLARIEQLLTELAAK